MADLLDTLRARCLPPHHSDPLPRYAGIPNRLLDEDIYLHENAATLRGLKLRRHTKLGTK